MPVEVESKSNRSYVTTSDVVWDRRS